MNKIKNFTDLKAWSEGHKLVLVIYKLTNRFPKKEMYVLTSQLLRAVISVTSDIAEGFARRSLREKVQFYSVAQSSLTEAQNQLIIARDLDYMKIKEFNDVWNQTITVSKMLSGLITSLKKKLT